MPTRFAQQFARTGGVNLIRQFGEPIGYYNLAGDPVRNVNAMVQRDGAELLTETGDTSAEMLIVRVLNDATTGISSAEIDTGGDEISISPRVGEPTRRMSIVKLINDNAGMTRFLVQ